MARRVSGLVCSVLAGGVLALCMAGAASAQASNASAGESAPPMSVAGPVEQDQPASADALAKVKEAFEHRFAGIQVTAVRPTPLPGLFEVQVDLNLMYTDANADYVLQGSLIDAKARVDLTAQHLAKLSEVAFDSLR